MSAGRRQIVVLGGTFDPVHNGHLIIAHAVAKRRGFKRVTLMPAASPPHKPPTSALAADRLAMLRLAIEGDDLFEVCEIELQRTGQSYTIDTIEALRARHGKDAEIHWIIGADMLADLPKWRRAADVVAAARIVVAARAPWQQRLEETFREFERHFDAEQIRGLRDGVVDTPLVDISSTEIRRRVAAGQSIGGLAPAAVCDYIQREGLYVVAGPSQ